MFNPQTCRCHLNFDIRSNFYYIFLIGFITTPPTKLRGGNVLIHACLSVCLSFHRRGPMWPLPMMHYNSLFTGPPPYGHGTWGTPHQCWHLVAVEAGMVSASWQYASYRNAFVFRRIHAHYETSISRHFLRYQQRNLKFKNAINLRLVETGMAVEFRLQDSRQQNLVLPQCDAVCRRWTEAWYKCLLWHLSGIVFWGIIQFSIEYYRSWNEVLWKHLGRQSKGKPYLSFRVSSVEWSDLFQAISCQVKFQWRDVSIVN